MDSPSSPPGWSPWARLDGSVDMRFGDMSSGYGGGVQAGAISPAGLRFGMGVLYGSAKRLFEREYPDALRSLRETDLYAGVGWAGEGPFAPLAGLRVGASVRTFEVGSEVDGELLESEVRAQYPVPFAGLEVGSSIALGSNLALLPTARLQCDFGPDVTLGFAGHDEEGGVVYSEQADLTRWSFHVGLGLALLPGR